MVDGRLQHVALGRPPVAVVDQLGVARHQLVLEMRHLTIERDRLDGAVGFEHHGAGGCFVTAAGLHAHVAVLDQIEPADAVVAGHLVQVEHHLRRAHRHAIDAHDVTATVTEFDVGGLVGRLLGRHGPAPHVLARLPVGVFEAAALVGDVKEVGVHRVGGFLAALHLDGDAVGLAVVEQRLAGGEVPLAPRRDHFHAGHERVSAELEADLVVALAGGAVGDGIRAALAGDLDEALGDQRAGDGGAKQVLALVDGVGTEHGEDEVAGEFLAQVVDVDFLDAKELCLLARGLEFLALTDVGGEGHHLAAVVLLEPAHDHRGVEATGIGEDDFLDGRHAGVSGAQVRRERPGILATHPQAPQSGEPVLWQIHGAPASLRQPRDAPCQPFSARS